MTTRGDSLIHVLQLAERRVAPIGASRCTHPELRSQRYWLRPWVATLAGSCPRFGFAREFVKPQRDYRETIGYSGQLLVFFLRGGIYEVKEIVSRKHERRYFLRVQNGAASEVSKEQAIAWLEPVLP